MQKKALWASSQSQIDLDNEELETLISRTLTPVEVRPEFVRQSKERLLQAGEKPSGNWLQYTLFGLAGVVTSIILLVTGIRATRNLIDSLGIPEQVKKPVVPKTETHLTPAI